MPLPTLFLGIVVVVIQSADMLYYLLKLVCQEDHKRGSNVRADSMGMKYVLLTLACADI